MTDHPTNALVGLPYRLHGRDYVGCDCWGVVYLWMRDVAGINVPSYVDKTRVAWPGNESMNAFFDDVVPGVWHGVATGQERIGDVARIRSGRWPVHVGVMVGPNLMLHSEGPDEVHLSCIEPVDSANLKHRITGWFRHQALMMPFIASGAAA